MPKFFLILPVLLLLPIFVLPASAENLPHEVSRVLEPGQRPDDARLGKPRTLRDANHPWSPPATKAEWHQQADRLRKRVLISNGLWPLPPKTPLKPIIHGKIDRGDYTIEKVFFASHPGHYVTGNLYRPKKRNGKLAGVLSPHGHWANGRFYDAGESKARNQIDMRAEKTLAGSRYPLQARMVQLARMGCVVFHYDMVGYADSQQIGHSEGFTDAQAGLRLQNFMGLQTFNSIRALDFLLSLPDVDPERIGVTGGSGGGTQTFMLCAIDPRPAVAFPAVMVSTAMQGGCICENADYLRIGNNNIALAALFAPKPLAMSGADDWTIAIETKGLPELRQVYSLYGKKDFVLARAFPQFKHNYNRVSRQLMYEWFNQHLKLGADSPVDEQDFRPVPPAELSVFDDAHPLPEDAGSAADLRKYLSTTANKQFAQLLSSDAKEYQHVVGTAARVMLDEGVPQKGEIEAESNTTPLGETLDLMKGMVGRKGANERIPFAILLPKNFNGTAVFWVDGKGKAHLFDETGEPKAAVKRLTNAGMAVVSADLFLTGEFVEKGTENRLPKVDESYQGYTFGYNRPLLSNRVRDILTVIGGLSHLEAVQTVHLVATGDAGPWALLARGLAGDRVDVTIVDARGFSFGKVTSTADAMFLPGALKYGGLGGLAALASPAKLTVAGTQDIPSGELQPLQTAYTAVKGRLTLQASPPTDEAIVEALLK